MIEYRLDDIDKLKAIFGHKTVERALNSAVYKATRKGRTLVSKEVRQEYRFKARDISKTAKIKKAPTIDGIARRILEYTGARPSLIKFMGANGVKRVWTKKGWRKQVKVKVWKKGRPSIVKGGFVGTAQDSGSQQIFRRIPGTQMASNPAKEKLKKLTGPAIPQAVSNKNVLEKIGEFVSEELPNQFNHEMDHFIKAATGAL